MAPLAHMSRYSTRIAHAAPRTKLAPARTANYRSRTAPARDVRQHGLFGLGLPEVAVIAGVAAVVFGPSRLPELGKNLGKTVKSFQEAAKEFQAEIAEEGDDAAATTTTTTATDAEAKTPAKEEEDGGKA